MTCIECTLPVNKYAYPYCSVKCRLRNLEIKYKCIYCGNHFQPKTTKEIYCSRKCLRENQNLKAQQSNRNKAIKMSRFKIFARDNFCCIYCGVSSLDGHLLTIDHIYPCFKGGRNDAYNLATCCSKCNEDKQERLLTMEQILFIWSRNLQKDTDRGLVKEYQELVTIFEAVYVYRNAKIVPLIEQNKKFS